MIDWAPFLKALVASVVYSLIGIIMFAASFAIINMVSAHHVDDGETRREHDDSDERVDDGSDERFEERCPINHS